MTGTIFFVFEMIARKLPLKKIVLGTLAAGTATAGGAYAYHKLNDSEHPKQEILPLSTLKPAIASTIPIDPNSLASQKFELTIELEIFPIEHEGPPATTEAHQARSTNWLAKLFTRENQESKSETLKAAKKKDSQEQGELETGAVSNIINWIGGLAIKEDNPFWNDQPKIDISNKMESETEDQSHTTKDDTQYNAGNEDTEEDDDKLAQKIVFADVVEKDSKKCECAELARQGEMEAKMEPSNKPKSFFSNSWLSELFTQEEATEKSTENKDFKKCDLCVETSKQGEIEPKGDLKGDLKGEHKGESGSHPQANPGTSLGGGLSQEDKAKQALTTFNIKETGEGKARWIGGYGLRAIILSTILAAPKKPPTRALSTLPSKKE